MKIYKYHGNNVTTAHIHQKIADILLLLNTGKAQENKMNLYPLFGEYDVLAGNLLKMAKKSGVPERHISYRRVDGENYVAIATIDAMPNGNMMVCFGDGEKEGFSQWQVVTKTKSEIRRVVFRGPTEDIFQFIQIICDEIEKDC
jgi:hypothetical protein